MRAKYLRNNRDFMQITKTKEFKSFEEYIGYKLLKKGRT